LFRWVLGIFLVKRLEHGSDHPLPHLAPRLKNGLTYYFFYTPQSSWPVLGWPLHFTSTFVTICRAVSLVIEYVKCLALSARNSYLIIQRLFFLQRVHTKDGGILVLKAWKQSSINLNSLSPAGHNWEASFYYNKALWMKPTHTESLLGVAKILRAKGQYTRIHHIMHRLVIHKYTACSVSDSLYIACIQRTSIHDENQK